MTEDQWQRTVPCKDAAKRRKDITVSVTADGEIAVIAPPPGIAVLNYSEGDLLRVAIEQAQAVAANRRRRA